MNEPTPVETVTPTVALMPCELPPIIIEGSVIPDRIRASGQKAAELQEQFIAQKAIHARELCAVKVRNSTVQILVTGPISDEQTFELASSLITSCQRLAK